MQEFHPVTHQAQQATIDNAQKSIWQAVFLGWAIVLGSLFLGSDSASRTALLGGGWWAVQFVAAPSVRTLKGTRRLKNDVDSVYLSALQKVLYERLTAKDIQFSIEPQEAPALVAALPPHRNLAAEIAQLDGHVALVSKTRSGKTTLFIETIAYALQAGHTVYVVDGKGDKDLRAFCQSANVPYTHCNSPEKVADLFGLLDALLTELRRRQDGGKGETISLFADEFNLIRDTCSDDDSGDTKGRDKAILFSRQTKRILLQGAAEKIYLRASSHTSRVEDWGWNTGVLDSVSFLALGRKGAYDSIEDLIQYQIKGKKAKDYQEQLDSFRGQQFDETLILTTLAPMGFYLFSRSLAGGFGLARPQHDHSTTTPSNWTQHEPEDLWDEDFDEFGASANDVEDSEFEQIDGLSEEALAHAIVDLALDNGIKSPTAFVEAFWGYPRGTTSRLFQRARERAIAVYRSKGLTVWTRAK